MSLIQWNETLSVRVEEIDNQHKRLITYINELNEAMASGKGKEILGLLLDGLVKYTQEHFETEEKYFAQFGYPKAAQHIQEHKSLAEKVKSFKENFDKGTIGLSIPVMNFLSSWLTIHIQGSDKDYSAFFNEKGLK